MDPPTHGLLGAAIGQAFFARSLGRKAVAWGAFFNMLPDVDVLAIPIAGGLAEWKYHRGLTHGLWFAPVAGAALGWALWQRQQRQKRPATRVGGAEAAAGAWTWIALAVLSLVVHPLADAFTSYGTRLLWPSPRRYAWDALPIVDVFFSAALLAALVVGHRCRREPRIARGTAIGALAFCVGWEGYGLHLNRRADAEARRQLAASGMGADVHAYPVLLQPWLRRVVARDARNEAFGVGWLSTWRPGPIRWHFFRSAAGPEVEAARRLEDVRLFEWFAMGQVTASVRRLDGGPVVVELDDLRYGLPTDPEHGLWGVRAAVGPDGEPIGEVQRIRRPPPAAGPLLRWLWSATFE